MRSQPKIIYKDLLIYTAQLSMARFILAGNPGGGGTPIWNRRGCSSEILNLTPKGDHLGVAQAFCDP